MLRRKKRDRVYAASMPSVAAFQFDAGVADVFQDMVERSVPGYGLLLELIGVLAARYAMPGTNCYDLGCSLGASTLQLKRHVPGSCHVVGVDNSAAMVTRCKAALARDHSSASSEIRLEDLRNTRIEQASIVLLNFTLQFVPDEQRQDILQGIAGGLVPGGILILAEKVRFPDQARQDLMTELHHEFKKHHGYSELEIAQKRAALETVLLSNTEHEHLQRLSAAGFERPEVCFRCLNFMAFLAVA